MPRPHPPPPPLRLGPLPRGVRAVMSTTTTLECGCFIEHGARVVVCPVGLRLVRELNRLYIARQDASGAQREYEAHFAGAGVEVTRG